MICILAPVLLYLLIAFGVFSAGVMDGLPTTRTNLIYALKWGITLILILFAKAENDGE